MKLSHISRITGLKRITRPMIQSRHHPPSELARTGRIPGVEDAREPETGQFQIIESARTAEAFALAGRGCVYDSEGSRPAADSGRRLHGLGVGEMVSAQSLGPDIRR